MKRVTVDARIDGVAGPTVRLNGYQYIHPNHPEVPFVVARQPDEKWRMLEQQTGLGLGDDEFTREAAIAGARRKLDGMTRQFLLDTVDRRLLEIAKQQLGDES